MSRFRGLTSICVVAFISASTQAFASSIPLWSDLRDVARYRSAAMPDASVIVNDITADAAKYIPEGTQDTKITGTIALQKEPTEQSGLTIYGDVTAFMESKSKGNFIRRFSISVAGDAGARHVQEVKFSDVPLSELHFQIDSGLISREVAVEDPEQHIMMLFPIGVGGLDPAVENPSKTSLLTPLFENATLRRNAAIAHRNDPTYYRNLPFMAITTARGTRTAIGFHISILTDGDWATKGGNYLVRGFDSHGCMRLRQRDLNELFTILMKGGSDSIPVNVRYFIYNRGSDGRRDEANGIVPSVGAYPIFLPYYQDVKNYAAPGQPPVVHRDPKEHLVDMAKVYKSPDPVLAQLTGLTAQQKTDLMTYEQMIRDANFGPQDPAAAKLAQAQSKTGKGTIGNPKKNAG